MDSLCTKSARRLSNFDVCMYQNSTLPSEEFLAEGPNIELCFLSQVGRKNDRYPDLGLVKKCLGSDRI